MAEIRAELCPHPASTHVPVSQITVDGQRGERGFTLTYMLRGDLDRLKIPHGSGGQRTNGLWKHTCFELFVRRRSAQRYYEFNFAPNRNWTAYQFENYRAGGADLQDISIKVDTNTQADRLTLSASINGLSEELRDNPVSIGLAAVIEAQNNDLAYWALHHPLSKPDFHHIDSFNLNLD